MLTFAPMIVSREESQISCSYNYGRKSAREGFVSNSSPNILCAWFNLINAYCLYLSMRHFNLKH